MKPLASVLASSKRILIGVLIGILAAMTLPDLRWRPPAAPYVPEKVKPSHRASMLPILNLWNRSPDGPDFCSKVKSLPGCWDVSDNFIPGSVITGIVRTRRSEALLVTILPPGTPAPPAKDTSRQSTKLPVIVYHVPKSAGVFIVDQMGGIRSMEKTAGYEHQLAALKQPEG